MRRPAGPPAIPVLLGLEAAIVLGLHRLGRAPSLRIDLASPRHWLAVTPPEDALAAVVRLLALGLAWWLLITTAVYLLARLSGVPAAVRAAGRVTLPAVRRAVGRRVTAGAVAGALAIPLPAGAQPVPPPPTEPPVVVDPAIPLPPGLVPPATVRPSEATAPAAPPAGAGTHRVVAGDNLWTIARDRIAAASGREPDVRDVGRYWRRLVEVNRGRLRSGDPDLIHPGETVRLPPIGE